MTPPGSPCRVGPRGETDSTPGFTSSWDVMGVPQNGSFITEIPNLQCAATIFQSSTAIWVWWWQNWKAVFRGTQQCFAGQAMEISLETKPWKQGGNFQVWFRPLTTDNWCWWHISYSFRRDTSTLDVTFLGRRAPCEQPRTNTWAVARIHKNLWQGLVVWIFYMDSPFLNHCVGHVYAFHVSSLYLSQR